jgi:hypothetical protein
MDVEEKSGVEIRSELCRIWGSHNGGREALHILEYTAV